MNSDQIGTIDIITPVHNEGGTIANTLREFYARVTGKDGIQVRFIVCEDGSSDDTVPVLTQLKNELPIELITGNERKGYSRAVIDGFRASTSEWVGFIDSDGQCDPADLKALVDAANDDFDLIMGYRNPRSDHWIRLAMSGAFRLVYEQLFPVSVKDPSCPYLLVKRSLLESILAGKIGILKQGFWWEFLARAVAAGARLKEVPVCHRVRQGGETRVYRPTKVPKIAAEHLRGLFELRRELHL